MAPLAESAGYRCGTGVSDMIYRSFAVRECAASSAAIADKIARK
jgi:hypothetical protein